GLDDLHFSRLVKKLKQTTYMFFRSGFEVQMTSMKSRRLRGSLPDDFLEDFQEVVWTSRKSSGLPGSRLDFQEVVWTSWKSSGLHGSLLTKSPFHNRSSVLVFNQMVLIFHSFKGFSDLEDFWDDLPVSRLKYNALDDFQEVFQTTSRKSSRLLPLQSSGLPESRLDFLEVVWKSSGLPKSRLDFLEVFSQSLLPYQVESKLVFTTYNSVVRQTTYLKQISKSIAKITSALTRQLPAHIRLLQAHNISNESDPPIIVNFYDFMNHKKCKIKILSFFNSMWKEEWKKKKGNSILGALRASNWLFMVLGY
ncbi:hypothetical protein IGI04_027240, partial [Brassica rapa subsp. trilocularis]